MTSAVRDLLRSFQSLSDAEQHEAAAVLVRQVVQGESGDVGEDGLAAIAEELFLDLDAREAGDAVRLANASCGVENPLAASC